MTTLIHVLGADIPHHNHTVLRYLDQTMASHFPSAREVMVVCRDQNTLPACPALVLRCWPDKKSLAQAVIARAKADRRLRFFFHGQFNPGIWLALLSGGLRREQAWWHIWGADLYENATSLRYRLFYLLRRVAQGRMGQVLGTCGDIHVFQRRHPNTPVRRLYFPTRMAPVNDIAPGNTTPPKTPTILLGNSGDRTNAHISALQQIARQFGRNVKIVIPMGYPDNNQEYIAQVTAEAARLYPDGECQILHERLSFEQYQQLIATCDVGYFIFARQQGIGTLCLLIQAGVPCVLSRDNPFWQDMVEQQLPVLFSDDTLNLDIIIEARRQLALVDLHNVAFFNPNYTAGWLDALTAATGVDA